MYLNIAIIYFQWVNFGRYSAPYGRAFEVVPHVIETDKPCLHGFPIIISHARAM